MSKSTPQTSSNSGRYTAWDNRNPMQAVSGEPFPAGRPEDPAPVRRRELCSFIPVARPSQKFPPKNSLLCRVVVEHGERV